MAVEHRLYKPNVVWDCFGNMQNLTNNFMTGICKEVEIGLLKVVEVELRLVPNRDLRKKNFSLELGNV